MKPFLPSAIVILLFACLMYSCDKEEPCDEVCDDPCSTLDEETCECAWDPACHCNDSIKNGDEAYINCGGSCEPCVCTDEIGGKYCDWLTESASKTWVAEELPGNRVMYEVARDYEGRIIPLVYNSEEPERDIIDSIYSEVWYPGEDPPDLMFLDYPSIIKASVDKTLDVYHIIHEPYSCDIYTWEFENPDNPEKQGLSFHWNGVIVTGERVTEHCNNGELRIDGGIIDHFCQDSLILYFKVDPVYVKYFTDNNFWVRLRKPEPGDSLNSWYITYYPED
jgi:hypothetical protein